LTTRRKYWLHFMTPKQPTVQARAQVEAQTALNFGIDSLAATTQVNATRALRGSGRSVWARRERRVRPHAQYSDETHENCPRNALRASRRNARETVTLLGHERWVVDEVSCRGHHQVREGVCEGRQEGQGQGSRRGRVGDRLDA